MARPFLSHSALVAVLALGILNSGCLEADLNVKIAPGRSGEIGMTLKMLEPIYQLGMMQLGQDPTSIDEHHVSTAIEERGGTLTRFENRITEDGVRHLAIAATFTDMTKIMAEPLGGQATYLKEGELHRWQLGSQEMLAPFHGGEDLESALHGFALMAQSMAGMKVRLKVQVPELMDTNLIRIDESSAHYDFDFDRDIGTARDEATLKTFRSFAEPKWIQFKGF